MDHTCHVRETSRPSASRTCRPHPLPTPSFTHSTLPTYNDRHSHPSSSSSPLSSLLLRRINLPLSCTVRPTASPSTDGTETEAKSSESLSSKSRTESEPIPVTSAPYVWQKSASAGSGFYTDALGIDRLEIQRSNPVCLRVRFWSL